MSPTLVAGAKWTPVRNTCILAARACFSLCFAFSRGALSPLCAVPAGAQGSLTQQQLQLFNANPHHIEVRIPLDGEHMRSDGSNFQQRYMGKMSGTA